MWLASGWPVECSGWPAVGQWLASSRLVFAPDMRPEARFKMRSPPTISTATRKIISSSVCIPRCKKRNFGGGRIFAKKLTEGHFFAFRTQQNNENSDLRGRVAKTMRGACMRKKWWCGSGCAVRTPRAISAGGIQVRFSGAHFGNCGCRLLLTGGVVIIRFWMCDAKKPRMPVIISG